MTDLSIWDAQAGRSRLCAQQCATCVFRPGNQMKLRSGRLRDLVNQALATTPDGMAGTYIVCHETLPYAGTGAAPAICRGFKDRYDTQSLQLIERLWGFVEVDPPDHIGQPMEPDRPTVAEEKLYTPKQAAAHLGVAVKTINRWDDDGKLPAVRLPNRHRRYRQHDLEAVRAGRPLPVRDDHGNVVAESAVRPDQTAVDARTPSGGE